MSAVTDFFHGFRGRVAGLPKPVKIVLLVIAALLVYLLPIINPPFITTTDSDFASVLFSCSVYALVALGLNVVIGYAGLLDLGYVGFFAIGAYAVGVFGSAHGTLPWLLCVPLAIIFAMVSGILLGAPTLRVRGDYLAIVTLGFGEIIRLVLLNSAWLGAAAGISNVPSPTGPALFSIPHLDWSGGAPVVDLSTTTTVLEFGVRDATPFYWLALTVVIIVIFIDRLMQNSRVGRAWEATREDEDAAELMGVPTFRFKLLAFAIGACIGGLSGSLFAARQGFLNPDNFTILYSVLFVAMVVVGGQGNRWGVISAAFLLTWLPEKSRFLSEERYLLFGLALMALAIFRPQGLLPPRRAVRAIESEEEIEALEEGTAHA
ncbi:MAG: branched-chain amino acid ABC transporter permease [Acidimicrobiales bacterium]